MKWLVVAGWVLLVLDITCLAACIAVKFYPQAVMMVGASAISVWVIVTNRRLSR